MGRTARPALAQEQEQQAPRQVSDRHAGVQRLLTSGGIDTEASFTPDGKALLFSSDRGGSPQIYRLTIATGAVERMTFEGGHNVSPRATPDGKGFVFVRRDGGRFMVAIQDYASRQVQTLTPGPLDESPSIAPNSKLIIYAAQQGGRGILAAVSSDGRVKQRLVAPFGRRLSQWTVATS